MKKLGLRISKNSHPPKFLNMDDFGEVVTMIQKSRHRTLKIVNNELITLYWKVGEHISRKIQTSTWGEGVVAQLAKHIEKKLPDIKGFTRPNLFRMRQFYETYRSDKKVSPLVRQLPWTHHILILSRCKKSIEREFYIKMSIRERWSSRQLEQQLKGSLFERALLNPPKVSAVLRQLHPTANEVFKDSYLIDFLNLPDGHSERDLEQGLVTNLRRFLIELGSDFAFVGEQVRLQVGGKDFAQLASLQLK
jgi:predicted nuclease of restriction endonuclease-like (RecB) superfamily